MPSDTQTRPIVWTPEAIEWLYSTLTLAIWMYIVMSVLYVLILMAYEFTRK